MDLQPSSWVSKNKTKGTWTWHINGWENRMLAIAIITLFPIAFLFDKIPFVIVAWCGVGYAFIAFIYGFEKFRQKRLIENIPTSTIRAAAMGLCEVKGELVSGYSETFTSEILKEKALYYHTKVQEERGSGKHKRMVTLLEQQKGDKLYLSDGTGVLPILVRKAQIQFEDDLKKHPRRREIIKEYEKKELPRSRGKRTYSEIILREGDRIYALGTLQKNPDQEDTKWSVVLSSDTQNSYFSISDKGEKALAKKMMWLSLLGISVGLVLLSASLISIIGI